jgi:hypothetical protein
MMNKVIILVTVVACICAVSVTGVSAKTRDGVTPAEESVCDALADGTPGLFGLCVAYCEAKDCDDPLSDCGTSGEKILENYNKKKAPGDPDMPCIAKAPTSAACPCFSEDDVLALNTPYSLCFDGYRGMLTAIMADSAYYRVIHDSINANLRCYNGTAQFETTSEENAVCLDLLSTAINRPNACTVTY